MIKPLRALSGFPSMGADAGYATFGIAPQTAPAVCAAVIIYAVGLLKQVSQEIIVASPGNPDHGWVLHSETDVHMAPQAQP